MQPHYLVKHYERGRRLVDGTEQFLIHAPDTRCVTANSPDIYSVPAMLVQRLRTDAAEVKICGNCLPEGVPS